MHGFILAATHHSNVVKIVLGAIVLLVSRGAWIFRRNRRRRG
jgi:hypothetical protein